MKNNFFKLFALTITLFSLVCCHTNENSVVEQTEIHINKSLITLDKFEKNNSNHLVLTFKAMIPIKYFSIDYIPFSNDGAALNSWDNVTAQYKKDEIHYKYVYTTTKRFQEEITDIHYEVFTFEGYATKSNYKNVLKKVNPAYTLTYLDGNGKIEYRDTYHSNDEIITRTPNIVTTPHLTYKGYKCISGSILEDKDNGLYDFSNIKLNRNYLFKPEFDVDTYSYTESFRMCYSDKMCSVAVKRTVYRPSLTGIIQIPTSESNGSGVVYKVSGNTLYVLSCYHVIDPYDKSDKEISKYTITSNDKTYNASLLAYSQEKDLAVLSFVSNEDGFYPREINFNFNPLFNQSYVLAIGNPNGEINKITTGKILSVYTYSGSYSGDNRYIYNYECLAHTASIDSGNSGGGLYDAYYNLIGINAAGGQYSYAVSAKEIYQFLSTAGLLP